MDLWWKGAYLWFVFGIFCPILSHVWRASDLNGGNLQTGWKGRTGGGRSLLLRDIPSFYSRLQTGQNRDNLYDLLRERCWGRASRKKFNVLRLVVVFWALRSWFNLVHPGLAKSQPAQPAPSSTVVANHLEQHHLGQWWLWEHSELSLLALGHSIPRWVL